MEKILRKNTWSWGSKNILAEFKLTKYLTLHDKKKKSRPSYLAKREWLYGLMTGVKRISFDTWMAGKMNQTRKS